MFRCSLTVWFTFLVLAELLSFPVSAKPASSKCKKVYTVNRGDHFSHIAYIYGLTETELYALNPRVRDADVIMAGSRLCLSDSNPNLQPVNRLREASGLASELQPRSHSRSPMTTPAEETFGEGTTEDD